jgi:hypothetical protein
MMIRTFPAVSRHARKSGRKAVIVTVSIAEGAEVNRRVSRKQKGKNM